MEKQNNNKIMGPQNSYSEGLWLLHFIEKEKSRDCSVNTSHSPHNLKVEDTCLTLTKEQNRMQYFMSINHIVIQIKSL